MCKGYGYAIRSLFGSMLLGIFTSSIIEIVVVKGLDFLSRYGLTKIDYNFASMVLIAIFINMIFSKSNIINYLFINGCSRKKINNVKIGTMFFYTVFYFLIYIVCIFFVDGFVIYALDELITILLMFVVLHFSGEIATYINLTYRKKSIEKGKEVIKVAYRYIYTFIFVLLLFSLRFLYPKFIEYIDILSLSVLVIVFLFLDIIFMYLNRRNILKVDIRV